MPDQNLHKILPRLRGLVDSRAEHEIELAFRRLYEYFDNRLQNEIEKLRNSVSQSVREETSSIFNGLVAPLVGGSIDPLLESVKTSTEVLEETDIPNLDASKIVSGTLNIARIPNLDANKITSGTLTDARIPNLNASKTNAGIFDVARIPDLDANKIITGNLSSSRQDVDTIYSSLSKTLGSPIIDGHITLTREDGTTINIPTVP